jgi:hypothetical protein
MSTFQQLLNESVRDSNSNQYLTESSMGRFLMKFKKYDAAVITAYRGHFSKSENKARNKQLYAMLASKKYSSTSVKGSYIENLGSENQNEVSEHSFVVVNHNNDAKFLDQIKRLGEKFDQDSVLIIQKGESPYAYLMGTSRRDDAWPAYGRRAEMDEGIRVNRLDVPFITRLGNSTIAFLDKETKAGLDAKKTGLKENIIAEGYAPQTINGIRGVHMLGDSLWAEMD